MRETTSKRKVIGSMVLFLVAFVIVCFFIFAIGATKELHAKNPIGPEANTVSEMQNTQTPLYDLGITGGNIEEESQVAVPTQEPDVIQTTDGIESEYSGDYMFPMDEFTESAYAYSIINYVIHGYGWHSDELQEYFSEDLIKAYDTLSGEPYDTLNGAESVDDYTVDLENQVVLMVVNKTTYRFYYTTKDGKFTQIAYLGY